MLNAARLPRGWQLGEAARLPCLPTSCLLDVEAGLCRPSRAVAEPLAGGLQLNDAERAQLFACDDVAALGHSAGAQPGSEDQEPRRGAGLTPFVAAPSTVAPPRTGLALCRFVGGGRHVITAA